jgi:hypothetical protein
MQEEIKMSNIGNLQTNKLPTRGLIFVISEIIIVKIAKYILYIMINYLNSMDKIWKCLRVNSYIGSQLLTSI